MGIYVNRTLNMKHIQAIGFDMDYTLIRYHAKEFEGAAYNEIKRKLISKGYSDKVLSLKFDYDLSIRGLVIDKHLGNVLKLSLYSKVKQAYHGTKPLDFKTQQKVYQGLSIDLNDSARFGIVDTTFSLAYACMFMQLVDLRDQMPDQFPDYLQIELDCLDAIDISHRDGSLKGEVRKNIKAYIKPDPESVTVLENLKRHEKKLWLITNSDFEYTKLLLDFAVTPYLKENKDWMELFDLVITSAAKPRFFTDKLSFLSVDLATGSMKNHHGPIKKGIYQGGCASQLVKDYNMTGESILYLGDHIYGDILSLKKTCNWRTALVVEEIEDEVKAIESSRGLTAEIDRLMNEKLIYEQELDASYEMKEKSKEKSALAFKEIDRIDKELADIIKKYQAFYNPYWGELMRAGVEPSRFAGQVEKYACIYMSRISDFQEYTPRTYFRPKRKSLPHE